MTPQENGAGLSRPTPKAMHAASGANRLYNGCPPRRQPAELLDRGPPKDVDAERAVLAVVLLEPRRMGEIAAALEPTDFADEVNRTIYGAMLRLDRRGLPSDITLLVGELRDADEYSAEDGVSAAALANLYRLYPLACNLRWYVARVSEMSRRRHALDRGIALIQAAHGGEPGPTLRSPAIRRATQHALEHRARRRKGVRP